MNIGVHVSFGIIMFIFSGYMLRSGIKFTFLTRATGDYLCIQERNDLWYSSYRMKCYHLTKHDSQSQHVTSFQLLTTTDVITTNLCWLFPSDSMNNDEQPMMLQEPRNLLCMRFVISWAASLAKYFQLCESTKGILLEYVFSSCIEI